MGDPIEIDDLDTVGVIKDEPSYQIAPEAWTTAENMRGVDGGMERMAGNAQVFGTPGVAPHLAIPVSTPSQTFWLYVGLQKGYTYDGVNHTNVTRQSAGVDVNYTTTETRQWNATIIAGLPILNNGLDIPQMWSAASGSAKLVNLANWPGTHRSRRIIAFGAYLIAMNNLEGANAFPHSVKWSTEVPGPGSVPLSWDYADPTVDAGSYDLPDVNSGVLVDAMPLGGRLMIYKEQSTWAMRRVGGRAVFAFDNLFETVGILAARCVAITPDGINHVVMTQDDIIIHNGSGAKPVSILDKRMRRAVFNDLDTDNYVNSFCFTDPEFNEVWCCYPQQGQTHPNRAVVFNVRTGALTESAVNFRNVAVGVIEEATDEVWDAGSDTWDTETGTWSTAQRRRLVMSDPANTRFLQNNKGLLRGGATYPATLQRIGLSVLGKKRSGQWIVDHQVMKFVDRLWPKVRGGPIKVRLGYQEFVDGPVTWGDYADFDPTAMMTADLTSTGRAIAVEFSTLEPVAWRIDGYKIPIEPIGEW